MNGFICVDKTTGPSSFAAVRAAAKSAGTKKAGHAGTLDPMASGLLVVALGNCTRVLEYLSLEPKVYEFGVTFGKSTDTFDAEGNVVATSDVIPTEQQIINALANFRGAISQVPPKYSAIKIDGKRAYDLARKGIDVEMKSRNVNIFSVEMCRYDRENNRAEFVASCSAGTYIRSLACDIVKSADSRAECFVDKLRRTKTGRFDLSTAIDYQTLKNHIDNGNPINDNIDIDINKYIISAADAFGDDEKIVISNDQKVALSHGKNIAVNKNLSRDTLIAFDENGILTAALKKIDDGQYHPEKVFLRI